MLFSDTVPKDGEKTEKTEKAAKTDLSGKS